MSSVQIGLSAQSLSSKSNSRLKNVGDFILSKFTRPKTLNMNKTEPISNDEKKNKRSLIFSFFDR